MIGRLYGEILEVYLGIPHPARFAIAGAASLTVGFF